MRDEHNQGGGAGGRLAGSGACRGVTCQRVDVPGGFAIVCTRGRRAEAAPCSECKARPHTLLCDYALRGAKAGKTCSRRLCAACATKRGELDLCRAHARLADRDAPPAPLTPDADYLAGAPPPPARSRILDHLDGTPEDRVFSRVARVMRAEPWWSERPAPGDAGCASGEVGS